MSPLQEVDVRDIRLARVPLREREHLVGHVEPVHGAGGPTRRPREHVDAAARAEVEHRLALVQLGDRDRVPAAEARDHRVVRQLARSPAA